jgi:subtilisin-like proprotein convertase family protein
LGGVISPREYYCCLGFAVTGEATHVLWPEDAGGGATALSTALLRTHTWLSSAMASPASVPDGSGSIQDTITMTLDYLTIADLDVLVDLVHPDSSELTITLTHTPAVGAPVTVDLAVNDLTGPARGELVFDDQSPRASSSGMDLVVGRSLAGEWTLEVVDSSSGNVGELRGWKIGAR